MRRKPVNLKAKTKKLWEERGYRVANCESRWGGFAFDMFGFADLFCFRHRGPDRLGEYVMIQVGRWADHSTKLQALRDNLAAKDWLISGGRIVLSLWRYKVTPEKRRSGFEVREEDFRG
jgi:hypothetical protein